MKKVLRVAIVLIAIVSAVTIGVTYYQVEHERIALENNLRYRSSLLLDGLREAVEPNFTNKTNEYLQVLVEKYSDRQRIAGLAVVDSTGEIIAVSSSLPKRTSHTQKIATTAMDSNEDEGGFSSIEDSKFYTYASPLRENEKIIGSLAVVQYADYVNEQLLQIWIDNLLQVFIVVFIMALVTLIVIRWIVLAPMRKLTLSLRSARLNNEDSTAVAASHPFLGPLMKEVAQMQQSLVQARRKASEQTQSSLEKIDKPWTEERLKDFTKDILKDRTILVVSNLEPYIHTKQGRDINTHIPASGLITAIEPVMQATGGIWVAQGSGDADRLVVDKNDSILVPPDSPKYKLKRVWLTEEEMDGYYYGFSDQALYPLCHMAHVRPTFRSEDWEQYVKVNQKFAQTVLAEIKHLEKPVVFIQDFQFTLLPRLIKKIRPDATVGMFWHIPWVNAETFSICPWRKEILDGMLGADLLGFHTQLHCNNFIDTISRELESLIDYEHFTVMRNQHVSLVKAFPISITFAGGSVAATSSELSDLKDQLLKPLGIKSKYIGLGVDRLDYIKGVAERLTAIEILLAKNSSLRGKFTFIQISAPPETKSKKYLEFENYIDAEVIRINSMYKTKRWKPIVFIKRHHSHTEIASYYKIANFCLVSSLHDGMNLVGKEFIASRNDEKGVLILSQFAGASKELKDALIVNPYDAAQTAKAIRIALSMPIYEQTRRMKKLRTVVKNYNIYRWSAEYIKTIAGLE